MEGDDGATHRAAALPPDAPRARVPMIATREPQLDGLGKILSLLRAEYAIDFNQYKPTTIGRRVQRRLTLSQVEDLGAYAQLLRDDRCELDALFRDLLIGVTRFFRDPEAFASLAVVLAPLLQRQGAGGELRVWVPACATGEEAYTVTALVREAMLALGREPRLKVFATDVHRASLAVASAGRYSDESLEGFPPDLRERHFARVADGWVARPELRKHLVFAPHDVLRDPPFSGLDLITCRNLLIYFLPHAQRRALSLFHFSLLVGGLLLLGPSETPGELHDELQAVDERWRLYRKRRDIAFALGPGARPAPPGPRRPADLVSTEETLHDARRLLVREYAPPALLVGERGELLHTFAGAAEFLVQEPPASRDAREHVDPGLKHAVGQGVRRALARMEVSTFAGCRVRETPVVVTVRPVVRDDDARACLVTITRAAEPVARSGPAEREEALARELRQTQDRLEATIEELETTTEQLRARDERLAASDEALQSAGEELQAVNQELRAVNAQLRAVERDGRRQPHVGRPDTPVP